MRNSFIMSDMPVAPGMPGGGRATLLPHRQQVPLVAEVPSSQNILALVPLPKWEQQVEEILVAT